MRRVSPDSDGSGVAAVGLSTTRETWQPGTVGSPRRIGRWW